MSRIRTMTGTRPELIETGSRPPAELLPPALRELAAEHAALGVKYYAAQRAGLDFRATWNTQIEEAKAADGKANAIAARSGKPIGTAHVDALTKARADAEAELVSLSNARSLVASDFYEVMSAEREGGTHDKALEAARGALIKAAVPFLAAIRRAVVAKSVHEWVYGLPFDGSEAILAEDLVPGLRVGNTDPPRAAAIVAALVQITD